MSKYGVFSGPYSVRMRGNTDHYIYAICNDSFYVKTGRLVMQIKWLVSGGYEFLLRIRYI